LLREPAPGDQDRHDRDEPESAWLQRWTDHGPIVFEDAESCVTPLAVHCDAQVYDDKESMTLWIVRPGRDHEDVVDHR